MSSPCPFPHLAEPIRHRATCAPARLLISKVNAIDKSEMQMRGGIRHGGRSSLRPRDAQQKRALLERFDVVRQSLIQSEKTTCGQVKGSSFCSHLNVAGEGLD